ncbi:MAG TPA: sulfatase-like hydrolase/transferase, partial [Candidatus Obscuribacterales bacterium]
LRLYPPPGYDPVLFGYTDTSLDPTGYPAHEINLDEMYMGVMPGFRVGVTYTRELFYPWFSYLAERGYRLPDEPLEVYSGRADYPGAAERGRSLAAPVYAARDSDTAFTADRVIEYLEAQLDCPWFVHAVFLRPHPPLFAPEPYNSMFDPAAVPFPCRLSSAAVEAEQHPFLAFWLKQQTRPGFYWGHDVNVQALPDHEVRQMIACYYGLINEVDHHIGRLLDCLERTGQLADTLIVFTCDHGEQLGDHWLWDKGGYFDQSYHIPLIVRDPRPSGARGVVVDAFTEAVDIMPTVLEWLGAPVPAECDGRSLLPWLEGRSPEQWRDCVHWEYDFRDPRTQEAEQALGLASDQCTLNVIRDRRYKYVHFAGLPALFFDLEEDPMEFRNRAQDNGYQSLVLEYAQKLLSLRMTHAERTLANTLLSPDGIAEYAGPRFGPADQEGTPSPGQESRPQVTAP